jgi:tetratricopeptide (TPR) repeat protein
MAELDPQKFTLGISTQGGSENSLNGIGADENNGTVPLDHPAEPNASASLFDLGESLQVSDPIELKKHISITFQESCTSQEIVGELENAGGAEELYPNYHYQMGLVCKQTGLIDEAIKQFQAALSKGQRAIEASELLKICLKKKEQLKARKESTESFQEENNFSQIGRGALTMACSPHS